MRQMLFAALLAAFGSYASPLEEARFQSSSEVVLIPATVMDKNGALVTGLPSSAFTLTQDDAKQQITSFGELDLPASIGVVFDTSGSMRRTLSSGKALLRTFFDQCNPEDEGFLYKVSTHPDLHSDFTTDFRSLLDRTAFSGAEGATALTDTIFAAVRKMRSAHNPRKALLILSDGMDNHSRYSKAELMAEAVEADLQIYSISVFDPPLNRKPIELQEERQGVFYLQELSVRTGGFQVVVRDGRDIERAAATIGRAIRNQYVIGYVPSAETGNDSWHTVRVKLNTPGTTAYARPGFFSR